MLLINGNWQQDLPATDRAIQFGDGCFTTALIVQGSIVLPEQHIQRLREACQRLAITEPDWKQLADEMRQLADSRHDYTMSNGNAVLKVIISRGSGSRGYNPSDCQQTRRILALLPYPSHYHDWREQGVRLELSTVRLGRNPLLAGIKHLNRLEQVLISQRLTDNAEEALVLDCDGMLVECCAANLFWRTGKTVYTPQLEQCGVKGIMRQHIIHVLERHGWTVEQVCQPLTALQQASEMVICNALMPVLPVRQAHHWQFTSRKLYQFLAPHCFLVTDGFFTTDNALTANRVMSARQ